MEHPCQVLFNLYSGFRAEDLNVSLRHTPDAKCWQKLK
jgi:hypothetical protein